MYKHGWYWIALGVLGIGLLTLGASSAWADNPPPTPPPPGDGEDNGGTIINQIINNIIQFPFRNVQEAIQNAFKAMLEGSVAPMSGFFAGALGQWILAQPQVIPGAGGGGPTPPPPPLLGAETMKSTWDIMVRVSIVLWPLVLAIVAVIAAKDAVAAASWGIGDLKAALGQWLIAVLLGATSIYWMDWANRLSNAVTNTILAQNFIGNVNIAQAIANMAFGIPAGWLITSSPLGLPLQLFLVLFVVFLALGVLSALIFQVIARIVILYVLVAIAPVVMILSVLPPLHWIRFMWFKGFALVELIGPINALLLQLAAMLAIHTVDASNPVAGFVNVMGALGILSILITIDGVIIKGVFGAVGEIAQKAAVTTAGVIAMATAAIGAGLLGAAGGLGGTVTTSGLGGTGGGALGGGLGAAGGSGFNPAAALRAAGATASRMGGPVGMFGAGLQAVGGVMEQRAHQQAMQAQQSAQRIERLADAAMRRPLIPSDLNGLTDQELSALNTQVAERLHGSTYHVPNRATRANLTASQGVIRDEMLSRTVANAIASASSGPAPSGPAPSVPASSVPASSGPAPSGPAPSGPAPSGPAPSGPAPSGPAPSVPASSVPASSGPAPSGPAPSGPAPSVPAPSVPAPSVPASSVPAPSVFSPARGEQAIREALQSLPPPKEGEVRLYRGVPDYNPAYEFRQPYTQDELQRVSQLAGRAAQGYQLTPEEASFVKGAMNSHVRFYTDNPDVAIKYAGPQGVVLYVDVPREIAARHVNMLSSATAQGGRGNNYALPHALYRLGQVLTGNRG